MATTTANSSLLLFASADTHRQAGGRKGNITEDCLTDVLGIVQGRYVDVACFRVTKPRNSQTPFCFLSLLFLPVLLFVVLILRRISVLSWIGCGYKLQRRVWRGVMQSMKARTGRRAGFETI